MQKPYKSYEEFMSHLFGIVNTSMDTYLSEMKLVFASSQGGYKNVLYPDLEVAHDVCREKLDKYRTDMGESIPEPKVEDEESEDVLSAFLPGADDEDGGEADDLMSLLGSFSMSDDEESDEEEQGSRRAEAAAQIPQPDILEHVKELCERAELSLQEGVRIPVL